jgi:hypothetical protein
VNNPQPSQQLVSPEAQASSEQTQAEKDWKERKRALHWLMKIIGIGISAVGTLAIVVFAAQFWKWSTSASVACVAAVVAVSAFLVGGLLGFLFGIPRTLAGDATVTTGVGATGGDVSEGGEDRSRASDTTRYEANTNLEQISDWLTKILVGVGLTQIGSIAAATRDASAALKGPLGSTTASGAFGVGLGLGFLISGFLLGYLWTRIYLPGALRWSDQFAALSQRVERKAQRNFDQLKEKVDDRLREQAERDARALELLNRQLSQTSAVPVVAQADITNAIREASPYIKVQVYNQARTIRQTNWQNNKPLLLPTIPVWHALIEAGHDPQSYLYNAELGYVLKDQPAPNWPAAVAQFDTAIKMRDERRIRDRYVIEYSRALCRILIDQQSKPNQPSDTDTRMQIVADLKQASVESKYRRLVIEGPDDAAIAVWMRTNGVVPSDLD